MVPTTIKSYLDERGVPFRGAAHPQGVTAQEEAQRAHISGKQFGKTIVLKQGDQYLIALVPADEQVDLDALCDLIGSGIELASESEMAPLFPDCEAGAMPPFGGLYGMPVVADACLTRQATLTVNGGTHTDVIELAWSDFVAAEHPRIVTH